MIWANFATAPDLVTFWGAPDGGLIMVRRVGKVINILKEEKNSANTPQQYR